MRRFVIVVCTVINIIIVFVLLYLVKDIKLDNQNLTKNQNKLIIENSKLQQENDNLKNDKEESNDLKKDVILTGKPQTISTSSFGELEYQLGSKAELENNEWALIAEEKLIDKTPVIYGHNSYYGELFNQIKEGDIINLSDDEGVLTSYQVYKIETVDSETNLELKTEEMILYTCFPFEIEVDAPQRYVIHARMI